VRLVDILKRICLAPGVSGFEDGVRRALKEVFLEEKMRDLTVDNVGNLIVKWGKGGLKIALMAHMDEMGIVIRDIDERGYLHFSSIGGLDRRELLGRRVVIFGNGRRLLGKKIDERKVIGVIGVKPVHLLKDEEARRIPDIKDMFIDIGATSRKEAEEFVRIGDIGVVEKHFTVLPANEELVSCRSLDDRAGCAAIIEVLRMLGAPGDKVVYAVFTAQEEIGARGSRVAAFTLEPHIAFIVDVTHAVGFPGLGARDYAPIEIGKGPAIAYGSPINVKLSEFLIEIAEELKVPYQIEYAAGRTGTDFDFVQIVSRGILATVVSIPLKYMHSNVEVVCISDIVNTAKLLSEAIKRLKEGDLGRFKPS